MFYEKRSLLFHNYSRARDYFIAYPEQLIELEQYCTELVNNIIINNYDEIEANYNEATYLNAFWAKYPPDDRGRQPVGDQIPWIEVGEHSVGHKLSRIIGTLYHVSEIGLPSGADNRFVLYSDDIYNITHGFTNCAFLFLDIKSVGPRDNFDHTVISPYQVSGDGIWNNPNEDMENSRQFKGPSQNSSSCFFCCIEQNIHMCSFAKKIVQYFFLQAAHIFPLYQFQCSDAFPSTLRQLKSHFP